MTQTLHAGFDPGAARSRAPVCRVGPNAVLQLDQALRSSGGEGAAREVFERAGREALLAHPPTEMVDERDVAALFDALYAALPAGEADMVAKDAGTRTADYLLAHRIPGPAQWLLRRLPRTLAARLLLRAIAANAWTFAGSGRFSVRYGSMRVPFAAAIADNPFATPGCVWHAAVFRRLFGALITPGTIVRHTACCAAGARACRFEIDIAGTAKTNN